MYLLVLLFYLENRIVSGNSKLGATNAAGKNDHGVETQSNNHLVRDWSNPAYSELNRQYTNGTGHRGVAAFGRIHSLPYNRSGYPSECGLVQKLNRKLQLPT